MTYFVKNIQTSGDLFKHQYAGIDLNGLASSLDTVMANEGYKLVNGQKGNGDYEKGNRVLRILFGAFVKYYKFSLRPKAIDAQNIELLVVKTSSGFSGGLIGIGQVKKELKRLEQVFSGI
jgi:hypothetical protein